MSATESGGVLTAQDRCDSCGAAAYVRAMFNSGILDFCAHHARVHADAISKALDVLDETYRLLGGIKP